jgi:hypothetical protein
LESLLQRTLTANHAVGVATQDSLLTIEKNTDINRVSSVALVKSIAHLLGRADSEVRELTLHRFAHALFTPTEFSHFSLASKQGARLLSVDRTLGQGYVLKRRLCRECWRERQVILLPWYLPIITMCPVHEALLIDHCSGCQAPLPLRLICRRCAVCGLEWDQLETSPLAEQDMPASRAVTDLLWGALGCLQSPDGRPTLPLAPDHPLQRLSPAFLLQFIDRLVHDHVALSRMVR